MYTIVIADDEKLERDALRFIIEKNCENIAVVDARDGLEVVSVAREVNADIVFMDLKMPGMNGIDAVEQLKSSLPDCRFVILTAYADFESAQKGVKLGITDYLTKPVRPKYVIDLVARLIKDIDDEKRRRQREKELSAQMEKVLPYIRMQFVQDLVFGGVNSPKALYDKVTLIGLERIPQIAFVLALDEDEASESPVEEKAWQLQRYAVLDALYNIVSDKKEMLVSPGLYDEIVILTPDYSSDRQEAREWAIDFAEKLRIAIKKSTGSALTIGIGRKVDKLEDIRESYQDAREAKKYRFYIGGNRVIHIDDFFAVQETVRIFPHQALEDLCEKVKFGDLDGALSVLAEIYETVGLSANKEIWRIRTGAIKILCSLFDSIIERIEGGDSLYEQNLRHIYNVLEAKSFEGIQKTLNDAVSRLTRCIAVERIERGKRVIAEVMNYVKKHCTEQITLDEVARTVFLTPNYLSYLFKSETSTTFSEYLISCRLEKAKRLLELTDEPIKCIASKVGYCDGNYFSQVFKKRVGISPSEYRTNIRRSCSKTVGLPR